MMIRIAIALILAAGFAAAEGLPMVKDLAFLTGQWRSEVWGGLGEETWTAPMAGNMFCVWRFVKNGKLVFTEFVSLEDEVERGAVMRIKHFHPGMKGWEEKEESVVFYVTRFAPGDVEWSADFKGKRITIRYRAVEGGLDCTMMHSQDGKRGEDTVRFRRVQ